MAVKIEGRYYGGIMYLSGRGRVLGSELTDVRDDGRYEEMYCKECYEDVKPVSSYEKFEDMPDYPEQVQALCPQCGYGLTPTVEA